MDYSLFQEFGYMHRGDEWVMPRPRFFTVLVYAAGTLLALFGLAIMWSGATAEPTRDDRGSLQLIGLFMLLGGITFLLYGLRFRQAIDVRQQAFIMQSAYSRTVLPFKQITDIRPVGLTVYGVYQGVHYEAFSEKKSSKSSKRGLKISPSFTDQAAAEQFSAALEKLLQS